MGKSAPSPPAAPDPVATAAAQSASNVETARTTAALNRVNQYSPQGSIVYSQPDPNLPNTWNETTSLSPEQQHLYDLTTQAQNTYGTAANNQLSQASSALSQQFQNPSGTVNAPTGTDGLAARDQATAALMQRMQPQLDHDQTSLESRLRNQGLVPGTQAWDNATRQLSTAQNDARLGAIAQGGQEQQLQSGISTTALNNQINAGKYNTSNALLARQEPINEASALLTGQQVQQPTYLNTPQTNVAPTDVIGATNGAYQGQLTAYNSQVQAQNAALGGLYGLGGNLATAGAVLKGGALLSDRRLKDDISQVGISNNGLPIYLFRYKGQEAFQIGLMAQDVQKVRPEAVHEVGDYLAVDYHAALEG